MKHTMRILTFLMLAIVVGTGQTWGRLRGLGHIVCNEANVTGGTLTFYTDAACTDTKAITMTDGKSSNLSSEDLTAVMDGDNVIGYTVYIKTVPNYNYTFGAADDNGAVTFITAEKTTNIFQAPRRTQSDPTINVGHDIAVKATDKRYVYSFVMPANGANVTVHVNFPEKPKNTAAVSYIDADGTTKTLAANTAYIIDGTESKMGTSNTDTWYVCTGDMAYTSSITLGGDVNLILADGCQMSATTISGSASQLTVYAQRGQTGQMVATTYECGVAFGQRFVVYNATTGTAASAIVSGTVNDVTLLAGKTLRPLDGNYVSVNSGDFSFGKDADFVIGDTHYYKYAADDNVTLSYTGSGFVNVTGATLAAVANQTLQRTFTMPATDVELTATAVTGLTATSVAYDGTARTPEIKQGDDVFAPANYTIAYMLGDEAVTAADVKNAGTYTCTLTGVGQYIGTVSDIDFTINKKQTTIAVVVDNANTIVAGDDARITVTMTPKIDTWTQLNIGEKSYSVAVVNGEGHFVVTNLFDNTYSVTASFLENDNYVGSSSDPNYSIAVSRVKTALRISFDETDVTSKTKVVTVGEPVTVYVDLYTVPSDWDGDFAKASLFNSDAVVTVKCNPTGQTGNVGNYTLGLVNGHGSITFRHLPADECDYYIDAVYAGDNLFLGYQTKLNNKTLILTVNKTETTIGVGVTSPVIAK